MTWLRLLEIVLEWAAGWGLAILLIVVLILLSHTPRVP